MPIYEYHCNKCGCNFEEILFPSDGEVKFICPSCGGGDTCRLMSSFSCGSSSGPKDLSSGASPACSPSSGKFTCGATT